MNKYIFLQGNREVRAATFILTYADTWDLVTCLLTKGWNYLQDTCGYLCLGRHPRPCHKTYHTEMDTVPDISVRGIQLHRSGCSSIQWIRVYILKWLNMDHCNTFSLYEKCFSHRCFFKNHHLKAVKRYLCIGRLPAENQNSTHRFCKKTCW